MQLVIEHESHLCEMQLTTTLMEKAKKTSGHRAYDVQRELIAAVADVDLCRCDTTLAWGLQLFGSCGQLAQVLNAMWLRSRT